MGLTAERAQTITEKLEVETYGRSELEELQKALMQERAEIKARIDAESKNSASLVKHKKDLEQERDTKVGSPIRARSSRIFHSRRTLNRSSTQRLVRLVPVFRCSVDLEHERSGYVGSCLYFQVFPNVESCASV